jgi:hypothetical protein
MRHHVRNVGWSNMRVNSEPGRNLCEYRACFFGGAVVLLNPFPLFWRQRVANFAIGLRIEDFMN